MKYIIDIPKEYVIADLLHGKVLGIPFFLKGAHEYSFPTDIILEPYESSNETKIPMDNINHLPNDLFSKRKVFNALVDYYHIRTDIQLRSLKEALDRVETLNFPGEEVFTADEVYDILVDIGQHDKQFALGEIIKYSPSDVYRILKYGNDSEV